MGTNFYRQEKECPITGEDNQPIVHLCKISAGWKPLFYCPFEFLDVKDLKSYTKVAHPLITDEYGQEYTVHEFWSIIDELQYDPERRNAFDMIDDADYNYTREDFS